MLDQNDEVDVFTPPLYLSLACLGLLHVHSALFIVVNSQHVFMKLASELLPYANGFKKYEEARDQNRDL